MSCRPPRSLEPSSIRRYQTREHRRPQVMLLSHADVLVTMHRSSSRPCLLQAGPNSVTYPAVNTKVGNGATALHAAVENGHLACVLTLLRLGARQTTAMQGASPLLIALQVCHLFALPRLSPHEVHRISAVSSPGHSPRPASRWGTEGGTCERAGDNSLFRYHAALSHHLLIVFALTNRLRMMAKPLSMLPFVGATMTW